MLTSIPSLLSKGKYKPQGIPKINWADPRTIGLLKVYLLNGTQYVDLINGIVPTMTGTVIPKATHGGQAANFGAANSHTLTNYYVVNTVKQLGGQASFSIVAGIMNTLNTANTGDSFTIYGERAASGNDICKLGLAQGTVTTSPVILTYRNDAGTLIQTGTASGINTNDGRFHVVAGTKFGSGSNNSTVYLDGRSVGTASWNTNDNFTDASMKCFIGGDIADSVSGFPGSIHFVYLYKRSLTQSQINALTADPYGFLIFPQDYVYTPLRGLFPVAATLAAAQQNSSASIAATESISSALTGYQPANNSSLSLSESIAAALTARQQNNSASLSASESIAASLVARQQNDSASLAVNEQIPASITGRQKTDSASLAAAEVVVAAITARQMTNSASLSCGEIIAAALIGVQKSNSAVISSTHIVSAAINARQQTNFSTITDTEIIAAAIAGWQQSNSGSIRVLGAVTAAIAAVQSGNYSGVISDEVITATIHALEERGYAELIPGALYGFARLADKQLNSVATKDAPVYTVSLSDKAVGSVTLTDQRP